jgi:acetoin utilization protein AcuB
MMKISEIMTTDVITAGMDDTLGFIKAIFESHHIHHVPIMEADQLVGIVSDRDVLRDVSPYLNTRGEDNRALNTLNKRAHQIMTRDVITIGPADTIEDAAAMMLTHRFNCIPIQAPSGELVGMVTKTDILKCLIEEPQAV